MRRLYAEQVVVDLSPLRVVWRRDKRYLPCPPELGRDDLSSLGNIRATTDPAVHSQLRRALAVDGELTLLHMMTRAAGRRDWFIIGQVSELDRVFARGRPSDAFAIFLAPQFQIRGLLDQKLSRTFTALLPRMIPDREELIVAVRTPDEPLL